MQVPQILAYHAYNHVDNAYERNLVSVCAALGCCLLYFKSRSLMVSLLGTLSQNWVLDRRWHDFGSRKVCVCFLFVMCRGASVILMQLKCFVMVLLCT